MARVYLQLLKTTLSNCDRLFFSQLVVVKKVNELQCHFIGMLEIEYLRKVSKISFVRRRIEVLIVTQPVFIAQDDPASEFEVPCKESIHVEIIYIFVRLCK